MLSDISRGDFDGATASYERGDLIVACTLRAERVDFVTDHSNKGRNRELLRFESGTSPQRLLGFKSLVQATGHLRVHG